MSNKKERNPIKNSPSTKRAVIPTIAILLAIVIVISGISIYQSIYKDILPKSTPAPASTGVPDTNEWKEIKQQGALFYSEIFLARDKTFVSIPIKFSGPIQTAWLTLLNASESSKINSYLMTHPQLTNLTWSEISDGPVHLYQKNKTYTSIQAFLSNPPAASSLLIDTMIKGVPPYKNLKGFTLEDTSELDKFDYLLTTYVKSPIMHDAVYYENIIDASGVAPNQNNRLGWQVFVETATSSGYSLGSIHVDYRK